MPRTKRKRIARMLYSPASTKRRRPSPVNPVASFFFEKRKKKQKNVEYDKVTIPRTKNPPLIPFPLKTVPQIIQKPYHLNHPPTSTATIAANKSQPSLPRLQQEPLSPSPRLIHSHPFRPYSRHPRHRSIQRPRSYVFSKPGVAPSPQDNGPLNHQSSEALAGPGRAIACVLSLPFYFFFFFARHLLGNLFCPFVLLLAISKLVWGPL